jgi:hypothetical protein
MKYNLPMGGTFEGTPAEVEALMNKLGIAPDSRRSDPDWYYDSSSKGRIFIPDMATKHIKRALVLTYKKFFALPEVRYERMSLQEFCDKFGNAKIGVVRNLFKELVIRATRGEDWDG